MKIEQLTAGNWTREEAIEAVSIHYNAPASVDDSGTVIFGGNAEDGYGWRPAQDSDIPAILAIKTFNAGNGRTRRRPRR